MTVVDQLVQWLAIETPGVTSGRDYITTGGVVICTMLTVLGGVLIALINNNRGLTKRSLEAAESAADRSAPTGNGYAKRTEDQLTWLVREVGGMRADQRVTNQRLDTTNHRLDTLSDRFNEHLEA